MELLKTPHNGQKPQYQGPFLAVFSFSGGSGRGAFGISGAGSGIELSQACSLGIGT